MGSSGDTTPAYVYDQNGTKIAQAEEKLRRFKDIWVDIFRISKEENANFYVENERMVTNYLEENINRLDANNPLTKTLKYTQMLSIINHQDLRDGGVKPEK